MVGTHPEFIASQYDSANSISIGPFTNWSLICFGLIFFITQFLNPLIPSTNSDLSSWSLTVPSFYIFDSFSSGRTSAKQSQSLKKCLMSLRTLFFFSITSELPFCSLSPDSRYYFDDISFPCSSSSFKAKSHKIQRKPGKYYESSSGSTSPWWVLIWKLFDKLTTRLRLFNAFSSIVPYEL